MKNSFVVSGVLLCLIFMASCGGEKTTPEDDVINFANFFRGKVNANQRDSLKGFYPDIMKADSLVNLPQDTITVVETSEPGVYEVTFTEDARLRVKREENGNINVRESKGIFAFPDNKLEMARKTGMWSDDLNDAQFSDRINDREFYDFLNEKYGDMGSELLSVNSKFVMTKQEDEVRSLTQFGYYTITNNTDKVILPSYYKMQFADYDDYDGDHYTRYTEPGLEIGPKETLKVPGQNYFNQGGESEKHHLTGVIILLTPEQILEMLAPYQGDEYREYLESKK